MRKFFVLFALFMIPGISLAEVGHDYASFYFEQQSAGNATTFGYRQGTVNGDMLPGFGVALYIDTGFTSLATVSPVDFEVGMGLESKIPALPVYGFANVGLGLFDVLQAHSFQPRYQLGVKIGNVESTHLVAYYKSVPTYQQYTFNYLGSASMFGIGLAFSW